MKKLIGLMAVVGMTCAANAGMHNNHNHSNTMMATKSMPTYITVEEVMEMPIGRDVVLRGIIQTYLDDEMYRFVDSTGNVILQIDESLWPSSNGVPNQTVIIYGETDDSYGMQTVVDVDAIEVAN